MSDLTLPPSGAPGDPVSQAESYIGTPYVYGGACRAGMDCSGLIQSVYPNLPRVAHLQYQATTPVPVNQLQRGDLLFFQNTEPGKLPPGQASHVGIYDGSGNVIAASSGAGRVVRQPLSMWTGSRNWLGAGRVPGMGQQAMYNNMQQVA